MRRSILPQAMAINTELAEIAPEIATFHQQLPQLLRKHLGEFVLIKATDVLDTFPERSAALRAGYHRLGLVPFLVRQITDAEPVIYLPNVIP